MTGQDVGRPFVAARLLSLFAPRRYRDSLLDDLDEDFGVMLGRRGSFERTLHAEP